MKECSVCNNLKELSAFYTNHPYCKACFKEYNTQRFEKIKSQEKVALSEKFCPGCGRIKAIDAFSKEATTVNGVASVCSKCRYERFVDTPEKVEFERARKYASAQKPAHRESKRKYQQEYIRRPHVKHNHKLRKFIPFLYMRDEGTCGICALFVERDYATMEVDHIVSKAISRGRGESVEYVNRLDNLQVVHRRCNRWKLERDVGWRSSTGVLPPWARKE